MGADDHVERAIQALLDGSPLPVSAGASGHGAAVPEPLCVVDAIARAHRTAIFGSDISPDRPVSARWGHLEIRGEIGRGASGTVYRAWDAKLAREVALKLLSPDAVASSDAHEEGRLLARLNHPHIVRVFGADIHDGAHGIWMELLEGETLDEILARDGVLGAEESLLIGLDLARALSAVHAAGLLHRDIKARNVLRERGGRVVLMDLGAGRPADEPRDGGGEAGTPMYMAPEVLAGGAATVRSDIYALGVLLYRLLTRSYPVVASDGRDLRLAHTTRRYVPLEAVRPDLPAAVVTVVDRACDPESDARYASAAELEAALADALQRTLVESGVASTMARRWKRWRKQVLISAAAAALTLLSALGAWDATWGRAARRALGFTVPPRSTLYMAMNGGLGIVRGRRLTIMPFNPATAGAIAVSSDLGVRTMASVQPWTIGGAFRLDGSPVAAPAVVNDGACCWDDGTTDGTFNYAIRQDSTMLEPIGSRPLAPPGVYRFGRDWSNPQLHFPLEPDGSYSGIAYSTRSRSFWLTRRETGKSLIEHWSADGKHLSTPVTVPAAIFKGIGADPGDGTLWVAREQGGLLRLENFDISGQHLAALDVESPHPFLGIAGVEFAWIAVR